MEKLDKKITLILIIILLLVMSSALILSLSSSKFSEKSPLNISSFTKAICTPANFCQDFEISCQNNEIKSISPITGAFIQFPQNWKDPRNDLIKNEMC